MTFTPPSDRFPRNPRKQEAFSLVEILVAMVIIATLVSLGIGGWRTAVKRGEQVREVAAGKTLISAYLNYAAENDGRLMISHFDADEVTASDIGQIVFPDGTVIDESATHRYPYRLAPYFNYRINGVILVNENRRQVSRAFSGNMEHYGTSLCPAFGINYYFLSRKPKNGLNPDESVSRLVQAPRPSSLLAFATAFSPDVNGSRIAGRFGVEPPAYHTGLWDQNLHVDARHDGKVLCVMLDGSVSRKSVDELRDMRLWSKNAQLADDPNYRVAAGGSTGIGGGTGGR